MRKFLPLLPLLLAGTACSKSPDLPRTAPDQMRTFNVEEPPPAGIAPAPPPTQSIVPPTAAPSVAPAAAPGVAFNYRYAFRLPADRIARVQEEHASACEKLGVERCRITGMLYRLVDERNIEGRLALKLEPTLARAFGKQGIEAVTRAAGILAESEISGEDVGSRIAAATRSEGDLKAELAKLEQQLARPGVKPDERGELQARAGQLRDSLRALKAGRDDDREALASTPVVFQYAPGGHPPQIPAGSPIRAALAAAWGNVIGGAAVIVMILTTLLPWALVALLGWWGWRRFARRWEGREAVAAA
jgi:hypothetical protein